MSDPICVGCKHPADPRLIQRGYCLDCRNQGVDERDDTIVELCARHKALHEALRKVAIQKGSNWGDRFGQVHFTHCLCCGRQGRVELHDPGYPAAPLDDQETEVG